MWIIGLFMGFVWATFFPKAPYDVFAYSLTGGVTAIIGKRLFMKHNKFGNNEQENKGIHED